MEKLEKLELIDKLLRELEDLKNSQTSVMKKIGQIEADNIKESDRMRRNKRARSEQHR